MLRCKLTDTEKLKAGGEMADAQSLITSLEDELTSMKKDFQAKIQEAQATMNRNGRLVQTGFETRVVKCTKIMNYKTCRAIIERVDTKEITEDRAMTDTERQMEMGFND